MAFHGTELFAILGVFVIIVAIILYNNAMARRRTAAKSEEDEERPAGHLLSRFAHHEGSVVGETVAVEQDKLILKQEGVFKAVPLDMATLERDEVVLQGFIDWDAAKAEGAQWLERNRKGVDDEVTSDLTRSEDVKAPALAAWRERQGDEGTAGDDEGRAGDDEDAAGDDAGDAPDDSEE